MSQPESNPQNINAASEQPPIPDNGYQPRISETTLDLWGRQLPVGFLQDGQFHRNIEFKQYTMAAERELAKTRKGAGKSNAAAFASSVLAEMITSLGPFGDFQSLSLGQRKLILGQMYMADILYAYILLRIDALGPEVGFDIQCPFCDEKAQMRSSLESLDVTVPEEPAAIVRKHTLFTPVKVGDKGSVEVLCLQPPRWSTMANMKVRKNPDLTTLKFDLVTAAIMCAADGTPLHAGFVDQLTKKDFEYLTKEVDNNTPGPDLQLEYECPSCGQESGQSLRWDFDYFFGASSL